MKKTFLIRQTHIVRSPNIGQAKALVFDGDGFGQVLSSDLGIDEISETEVLDYINEKDSSYTHSSTINLDDQSDSLELSLDISDSRADFLRSENKRLARAVDKLKNVREEAVEAVYDAAYDAFKDFKLP